MRERERERCSDKGGMGGWAKRTPFVDTLDGRQVMSRPKNSIYASVSREHTDAREAAGEV